jgi:methyl-accepting chemotaxis protein
MKASDFKISSLLASGFGMMAFLILLMGATTLWRTAQVSDSFGAVMDQRYPKVSTLHHINDNMGDVARYQRDALLVSDADDIKKLLDLMAAAQKDNTEQIAALASSINSDEGKQLLEAMQSLRQQFLPLNERFTGQIRAGNQELAKIGLLAEMGPVELKYFDAIGQLIKYQEAQMQTARSDAAASVAALRTTLLLTGGFALLAATIAALRIMRAVTTPIHEAVEVARAVAAGDLSYSIHEGGNSETGELLAALKEMQGALVTVVANVRRGSQSVALASAEIAQGNQDLSDRTERQANVLQQTASSMQALDTQVHHNADNARQANQLAMNASQVAVQGGEVVGQVVQTMREINASSRRIADIISVIDGIAFQTNILALNAAVEAARAGEQGRGFAVVASEVRSLAGRSADAAKEIKSLINASVERVERGSEQVDQAGETMTALVAAIRRVTDIMGEISAASSEQSGAVAQVGATVTQMDQTTQQNAALVEQMAAAAGSLRGQASELVQAVAIFKLGGAAQAPVPHPVAVRLARTPTPAQIANAPQLESRAQAAKEDATWEAF